MIKRLVEGSHSKVFAAFYDAHADAEWVSSAPLRIELTPAVTQPCPHCTALGLPADFLIEPDGRVREAKYGRHASDQWSVDELIRLART